MSLSWMTGFDGLTPITGIEILVTPERGAPLSTNPIILSPSNQTIISSLLPFREHKFSVAVLNIVGTSERRNITASTLSLCKYTIMNVNNYNNNGFLSCSLSPSLPLSLPLLFLSPSVNL
ncbi:MAG: fibronectin type III domain-containing protein [Proteobacteria bacterium]|nr:fibronectin type III domain-containing protein [Pseudomonadota bacterium]